jgi:hypothetical protein
MTTEYLVPSANATTASIQILATNDYTLIDEGVAGADGSVNTTVVDDSRADDCTWALTNLTGFGTQGSVVFRVRARFVNPGSGDTATYQFRLNIGGSTYDITYDTGDENAGFTNYQANIIASFTEAQFNAATVTLTQTAYAKDMGPDGLYLDIDAIELEVNYTAQTNRNVTGITDTIDVVDNDATVNKARNVTGITDTINIVDNDATVNRSRVVGGGSPSVDTYYFDASDWGPTDLTASWSADSDAFDGSITTKANRTGTLTGELSGGGTTAPISGGAISLVEARIYAWKQNSNDDFNWQIWTSGKAESLLNFTENGDFFGPGYRAYETLSAPTVQVDTYYFDASIAGPTDVTLQWSEDSFPFNGVTTSRGTTATADSILKGTGTTAPTSGDAITQVRARVRGEMTTFVAGAVLHAEVFSSAVSLGDAINTTAAADWGDWVILTAPAGGWDWTKVNNLEVQFFGTETSDGTFFRAFQCDIEVTSGTAGWTWQKVNDLELYFSVPTTVASVQVYTVEVRVTSTVAGVTETITIAANDATVSFSTNRVVTGITDTIDIIDNDATVTRTAPREVTGITETIDVVDNDATVNKSRVVTSITDTIDIVDNDATVNRSRNVLGIVETIDIVDNDATVTRTSPREVTGITETIDVVDNDAVVTRNRSVVGITEAITIVDNDATINRTRNVNGITETIDVIDNDAIVTRDATRIVTGITETIDIVDNDAVVNKARNIIGITEAITIVDNDATINRTRNVNGITETIDVIDNDATINRTRSVSGIIETINIVESTAIVTRGADRNVIGITEAITIVDNDATVIRTLNRNVVGITETIAIAENDATVIITAPGRLVNCTPATIDIIDNDATVNRARTILGITDDIDVIANDATIAKVVNRVVVGITDDIVVTANEAYVSKSGTRNVICATELINVIDNLAIVKRSRRVVCNSVNIQVAANEAFIYKGGTTRRIFIIG